jgi:hypothetical protein
MGGGGGGGEGAQANFKTRAKDHGCLFLDPKLAEETRGGLKFLSEWLLVPTNGRFCPPLMGYAEPDA